MTSQERMIDRITKLLAKAESTTHPAEADALSAKATELMLTWAIDEAVVAARMGASAKPDEVIERRVYLYGSFWQAHQRLALAVARGFNFKPLVGNFKVHIDGKTANGYVVWIGFASDVAKAELLYTSLLIQCTSALRVFARAWNASHGASYRGTTEGFKARRSFIIGFADVVRGRLIAQRAEAVRVRVDAERERPATEGDERGTSTALVLAGRDHHVKEYFDRRYGDARAVRGRGLSAGLGGYGAGQSAGRAANIVGPSGGVGSGHRGALGR